MSYDNWKTTDSNGEAQQESFEQAQEIISNNGCDKCGNDDPDKFEDIETNSWKEGKYDCYSVTGTCKECGEDFKYVSSPDWDSMAEDI